MAEILGDYHTNYDSIFVVSEDGPFKISTIYRTSRAVDDEEVILKVFDKETLQLGDYNLLLDQIKREEEIAKLCKSKNIVNFYQKLETPNKIIFEIEKCEIDLLSYIINNEELKEDIEFFKTIVLKLAETLKIFQSKGVMHRDIKPSNIFLKDEKDKNSIKLGDFGCSTYIKDNRSNQIGTMIYSAPEIIKNLKYDEKCDLWSLGITLYQLYFGELPYGEKPTINTIINTISDPKNFNYKKTNIPCLDSLFKGLLEIEPKDRMTYEEFFKHVFDKDFMKNIDEIKSIIKNQEEKGDSYIEECCKNKNNFDKKNENIEKMISYVEGNNFPDIMGFSNGIINNEKKFNNIIYYDENEGYKKNVYNDTNAFERNTPGAFILCTNKLSLELVIDEIIEALKNDNRKYFNLITTGKTFDKVLKIIKEKNFYDKIKNICIYCRKLKDYIHLKNKEPKLNDNIYNKRSDIIKFINKYSSENIKPYQLTKLVTYDDYVEKYKDRHFKIAQFYGDLSKETYDQYFEKMKDLIKEESSNKQLKGKQYLLLNGFLSFKIKEDLESLDKLIIKQYTNNTYYGDLNKWLLNSNIFYEPVAYFTARLMYSLNNYAKLNGKYCKEDRKQVYRGIKIPYICLLQYERVKGKIIILSGFTSTSEDKKIAEKWSGRKTPRELFQNSKKFSVIYYITNIYNENFVSNGINVIDISKYKIEKEYLYQPFSFYNVKDVKIDYKEYTADIYLETIGKKEILEEKIRMGKEIVYNEKEKIIQIKE